jgi:hypothetical protein
MYVIVVGGGKVGANVARSLLRLGHEVTLIEQPTRNVPGQCSPRRASASSFSSTTVTSQPSRCSCRAIDDPTRPQPMINAFIRVAA